MRSRIQALVFGVALIIGPVALYGQFSFAVRERPVQIHSFAYSNDNNYLTMPISRGVSR